MKSKTSEVAIAGILAVILLGTSWAQAAAEGPAIKLQIQDNAIQVVTESGAPSYYLEFRTPTGTWQPWNADMQIEEAETLWFRAVFESGDIMTWEPPADATTFYSPSISADSTNDGKSTTTIGTMSTDGGIVAISDRDVMSEQEYTPPAHMADIPAPQNNQAFATPMPGTSQLIWRNTASDRISRWDLADTTGDEFTIRAYDRFRLLPTLDPVDLGASWILGGIAALDDDLVLNDFIWQNTVSGRFSLWRVNEDPTIADYGPIEYESSPGVWSEVRLPAPWVVAGIASLSGDGKKNDVIWQNPSSGVVSHWEIGGDGKIIRYGRIQVYIADQWVDADMKSPWTLGTVADLEGDGNNNDFIWHNPVTGRFAYWKVNDNFQITEFGPIQYEAAPGTWENVTLRSPWQIVGVTELDGDGKLNDIIWHEPVRGIVSRWDVGADGKVNVYGRIKYEVESAWQDVVLQRPWEMRGVVSVSDGNTLNSLVWHNPATGRFSCWRLTVSGDDTRISNFGPFSLNGAEVTLADPWEISEVRGN